MMRKINKVKVTSRSKRRKMMMRLSRVMVMSKMEMARKSMLICPRKTNIG
jgi:hypothetical protein